jgi:hypothetical protein
VFTRNGNNLLTRHLSKRKLVLSDAIFHHISFFKIFFFLLVILEGPKSKKETAADAKMEEDVSAMKLEVNLVVII